jgi:hypothetical protein
VTFTESLPNSASVRVCMDTRKLQSVAYFGHAVR